jgi:hypothetical protein
MMGRMHAVLNQRIEAVIDKKHYFKNVAVAVNSTLTKFKYNN